MSNKNYQIAKFYSLMYELKETLNSTLLPLAVHIGVHADDPGLYESIEVLASDIEAHLENYKLTINKTKNRR